VAATWQSAAILNSVSGGLPARRDDRSIEDFSPQRTQRTHRKWDSQDFNRILLFALSAFFAVK